MKFVQIPAGRFAMGSEAGQDDERPVHEVEVDAFACAVYPVTVLEYAEFLAATGHDQPRDWRADLEARQLPVTGVSWLDAVAFCDWRTREGDPMRLPTEAQWECAARGGLEGARYPCGDAIPAWMPDEGRGPQPAPWPVTLGEPNGYGLFGIGANIHEWCADWHAAEYYAVSPLRNPTGPDSGVRRASRGGAWRHAMTLSRCAQRSKIDPSFRYTDYGFRVVR
ncbi:MAG: SUMF1/EgtB/PvdO family nonheme iron enzyme [Acidobacteriota bacterium]